MEKPTNYTSAPKPPKQIRVEEHLPEAMIENKDGLIEKEDIATSTEPTQNKLLDFLPVVDENSEPFIIETKADEQAETADVTESQRAIIADENNQQEDAENENIVDIAPVTEASASVEPSVDEQTIMAIASNHPAVQEENAVDQNIGLSINPVHTVVIAPKSGTEKVKASSAKQKADQENEFENLKIPGDDELFQRQYYTMGEVATMFHANQSQIRFWENEFDILQPKKNKKGDRYFRPEDVKNLQVIHHLLRNRRFTIEGAREYLKQNKQRTQDTVSAIASLNQLKSFLVELKANL